MHPQIQDTDSLTMSALRSKADIRASLRQVCFVPILLQKSVEACGEP